MEKIEERLNQIEKKINELAKIVSELCKVLTLDREYAFEKKTWQLHEEVEKKVLSK